MPHVVVVGAGVFGAWTAWYLHAAGARVTLVDAHAPGHSRASSGGESRIIRCGYGADEIYSRFALRSLRVWRDWAASLGGHDAPIFHRCGVLWLATTTSGADPNTSGADLKRSGADPKRSGADLYGPRSSYVETTWRTLGAGGYNVQLLDGPALRERFPHIRADDIEIALLEPDGGVIMARRAVATLARRLEAEQVDVLRRRVLPLVSGSGALRSVQLADGGELRGDAFVFACGPWLPKMCPALLEGRIRPTRQVQMYFGTPAGDDRFGPRTMPAWVDFPAGVYGGPDVEGRGLKVGIDRHGPAFDPDSDDRTIDAESIAIARAWLARRLPDLADAPLVESRICQYENTSNGDFLIDRHPDHANVWIAGGGSGHGFKHGPAVGEYVASMVLGTGEPEPRFALTSKEATAVRSVY